jgi:hypothetical protein
MYASLTDVLPNINERTIIFGSCILPIHCSYRNVSL